MSVKIKERSSAKSSHSKNRKMSGSQSISSITFQNQPHILFQRMKQSVHNLFQLAKKQLGAIYKTVVHYINDVGMKIKQNKNSAQQITQLMIEIKRQSQLAMTQLNSKLKNLLVVPTLFNEPFRFSSNPETDNYGLGHLKPVPRKQRKYTSMNKLQVSINQMGHTSRNLIKKVTAKNTKGVHSLSFLQGSWPNLQHLNFQGKSLTNLFQFDQLKADGLQLINLSNNQISSLANLKNANLPYLSQLDVSRNRIRNIQGIQQATFPRLLILNLSKNYITNLEPLKLCHFEDLLQLSLQSNYVNDVSPLIQCKFINLQILNIDNNRLTNLQPFYDIPFYKLKLLTFCNNQITSIKFASRLTLRRLQGFIGHNNKIASIQPLADSIFPDLRDIILHNNQIYDISCVKRMNFPQLTSFDLQSNNIGPTSIGCFLSSDKGLREAKKKFPFILI